MARALLDRNDATLDEDPGATGADGAIAIVDEALMAFVGRTLVTGDEVLDRLLDLRNALVSATTLLPDLRPDLATD
jgi:hypothetical protein